MDQSNKFLSYKKEGEVLIKGKNVENESDVKKYPINVVRCEDCTLLQIDYIVDQKKVYHPDYPYLPGITPTVDKEQKDLSDYLCKSLNLKKNDLVVDIGSNDGSLLRYFKEQGLKTLGVEPTNIAKMNMVIKLTSIT